jgi:hypothetical protein
MWRNGSFISMPGTGWRDWPTSLSFAGRLGTSDPSWTQLTGTIYVPGFNPGPVQTDEVFGTTHINHEWKPRTDLRPHVHWIAPTTNVGDVVWGFEYAWTSGSTLYGPIVSSVTASTNGTANFVYVSEFPIISGSNLQVGGTIIWRFYRDGPSSSDTYTGFALPISFDIHIQSDRDTTSTFIPPFDT